ncbi:UNVERIFIED_CONTAM: hypothetical protein GTU68_010966 [Idotea baltica]|nr:hypothetical protein [Idotea baltica]
MKRLLLATLISILFSAMVYADSFTISDIRVNGLQRVSAGSVFGALSLNAGDLVDEQSLAAASRNLFKTGFFQDIKLSRDGDVLVVDVKERPSIASIKIEGNKAINTDDLLDGLKQSGLDEDEIFQQATLDEVQNELQRQYVSQGRYSSHIETEVNPLPRNRVALKIKINEGTVATIKYINVVGDTVFPEEDLYDLFELKPTHLLSVIKSDDKYSREKLSGDLERLRSYYLDRGYIKMDISSAQVSISPDKKNVFITVTIDEGDKYRVSDVVVKGDLKIPEKDVTSLLLVKPGQVFSRKVMTTSSKLVERRLGNDGYTFTKVNGVPDINEDNKTVAITFLVDPGKRAYVNRITFRGNTKTEDEVLRREMRQMEGGWASTYLIDQSKTRLERLGFFKNVKVETPPVPGTDDQIDVNYTVEEQASGSITASVGYAQNSGLILGGAISQSNFLGTGNKVSLNLTRSDYQSRYSFGFVNPYWTPDGVSLGYNVFYEKTDYDELDTDVSSYTVDSYGTGVTIGYPISETSRLNYGLTVQKDTIDTGRYTVDEIYDFIQEEGDDSYLNFKASIGWTDSALNRGLLPTDGHSQSLVLETTLPGSDLSFYKINYRGQVFAPINKEYALRFHTKLGYGNSFGSTSKLPFYENYFAGGFNSVRGFEDNALGPTSTPSIARDPNTGEIIDGPDENGRYTDDDQERLPFGGNVLITGGTELLFPLPFVKDQKSLRSTIFWDVGNVFDTDCTSSQEGVSDDCKVDLSDLASSVGFGLTWVTALGPLSFSIAKPIKEPDNVDTQFFQFSLGQTF